jgi:hypothetical protein
MCSEDAILGCFPDVFDAAIPLEHALARSGARGRLKVASERGAVMAHSFSRDAHGVRHGHVTLQRAGKTMTIDEPLPKVKRFLIPVEPLREHGDSS